MNLEYSILSGEDQPYAESQAEEKVGVGFHRVHLHSSFLACIFVALGVRVGTWVKAMGF